MSEKKEYIERGALSKFVRDVRRKLPKDSKDFFTRDEMLLNFQQYVDWQPAADVEPVVRCPECVNGQRVNNVWTRCAKDGTRRLDSFYCAHGKERER